MTQFAPNIWSKTAARNCPEQAETGSVMSPLPLLSQYARDTWSVYLTGHKRLRICFLPLVQYGHITMFWDVHSCHVFTAQCSSSVGMNSFCRASSTGASPHPITDPANILRYLHPLPGNARGTNETTARKPRQKNGILYVVRAIATWATI
jgi:hypothetical protein